MAAGRLDRKVPKPHVSFRCSKRAGFGPALYASPRAARRVSHIAKRYLPKTGTRRQWRAVAGAVLALATIPPVVFCFSQQISYGGWHADRSRHRQARPRQFVSAQDPAPRPGPDANARAARRIEAEAERTARARDAAARLDRLLIALEAPPVDEAARARLAKMLDRHGAQHVTLLIRTIIESDGNANALVEPVISAVSSVMIFRPEWANRRLDLQLFRPTSIGHYYFLSLRNRLWKVFEPPKVPKVKPPRKVYTYKRPRNR
jgi:hypothetical protein